MITATHVRDKGVPRFVPLQNLTERRDPHGQTWAEFLLAEVDAFEAEDRDTWDRLHRRMFRNLQFFGGEQLGYFDADGEWQNPGVADDDPVYVVNMVRFFVASLLKECARSQGELQADPTSARLEMRLATRPLTELLKLVQRRVWQPSERDRYWKYAILTGNAFRLTRFNPELNAHVKPRAAKPAAPVEPSWMCVDCGGWGMGGEIGLPQMQQRATPACAQCGSASVVINPAPGRQKQARPATEKPGDIETSAIDSFEVKIDLNCTGADTSTRLSRDRYILTRVLRELYPWAHWGDDNAGHRGADSDGLRYQEQMQTSAGNLGGGRNGTFGTGRQVSRFRQQWLERQRYAHFVWEFDEEMENGEVIRAGTRAIDLFPDGLYLAVANRQILDTQQEIKNELWTHFKWEPTPHSSWGHGIEDAVDQNEHRNNAYSLAYEVLMHNAAPIAALHSAYFGKADYKRRPGHVMVAKKGLGRDADISKGVHLLQPNANVTPLVAFIEQTTQDMQMTSGGTFSSQGALPDVVKNTASGFAMWRDETLGMHGSRFERNGECDVATAMQWLKLIRRHNLYDRYFARTSAWTKFELERARDLDPDMDILITVKKGSVTPRSALEQRTDLTEAATFGGVPGGIFNAQVFPAHIRRLGLERFGLPWGSDQSQVDERNTWLKIFRLIELAQRAEGLGIHPDNPDPAAQMGMLQLVAMAAEVAPVRYRHEDHETCQQTISEFFRTDDGMDAGPVLEILVEDLYSRHDQAMQQLAMEKQMLLAGAMPMAPPDMSGDGADAGGGIAGAGGAAPRPLPAPMDASAGASGTARPQPGGAARPAPSRPPLPELPVGGARP